MILHVFVLLPLNLIGACDMRIVFNKILNGWYIVRGRHDTPISGRFETKEAALAHLRRRNPLHMI